jgi:hypothetical protein
MTPPFGVAAGSVGHMYSSLTTTSPSARTGYHFIPKPELFGFIAPSAGSSVTAVAPLAESHLSNDASEPLAVPSKMYSYPGSGGGAVYCACAPAGSSAKATRAVSAGPQRARACFERCFICLLPPGLPDRGRWQMHRQDTPLRALVIQIRLTFASEGATLTRWQAELVSHIRRRGRGPEC